MANTLEREEVWDVWWYWLRAGVIKGGLAEQVPFKLSREEEEGIERVKDAARGRD